MRWGPQAALCLALAGAVDVERVPGVVVREAAEGPIQRRIFTVVRRESLARPALAAVRDALHDVALAYAHLV